MYLGQYYFGPEEFLEAGKTRLTGNTAHDANTGEGPSLHREMRDLKEVVAEQTLELRILKECMAGDEVHIE